MIRRPSTRTETSTTGGTEGIGESPTAGTISFRQPEYRPRVSRKDRRAKERAERKMSGRK